MLSLYLFSIITFSIFWLFIFDLLIIQKLSRVNHWQVLKRLYLGFVRDLYKLPAGLLFSYRWVYFSNSTMFKFKFFDFTSKSLSTSVSFYFPIPFSFYLSLLFPFRLFTLFLSKFISLWCCCGTFLICVILCHEPSLAAAQCVYCALCIIRLLQNPPP